jgi:quercetin dioxygenase-like cupin family protein
MAQQLTRKDLMNIQLDQKVFNVEIQQITLTAGQTAPKHLHPCSVVGYIASGSVLFQIEGEESKFLHEGDAFYEPKNKTILHFDNASKETPLTFITFYLKEKDEENIRILDQ